MDFSLSEDQRTLRELASVIEQHNVRLRAGFIESDGDATL